MNAILVLIRDFYLVLYYTSSPWCACPHLLSCWVLHSRRQNQLPTQKSWWRRCREAVKPTPHHTSLKKENRKTYVWNISVFFLNSTDTTANKGQGGHKEKKKSTIYNIYCINKYTPSQICFYIIYFLYVALQ